MKLLIVPILLWQILSTMAEGNGEISGDVKLKVERTEDFQKLIACGLDEKVAAKLDDIYKTGMLSNVGTQRYYTMVLHEPTLPSNLFFILYNFICH